MTQLDAKLLWKPSGLVKVAVKPRIKEGEDMADLLTGNINLRTSHNQRMSLEAQEEVKQYHGADGRNDSHVPSDGNSDQSDIIDP